MIVNLCPFLSSLAATLLEITSKRVQRGTYWYLVSVELEILPVPVVCTGKGAWILVSRDSRI